MTAKRLLALAALAVPVAGAGCTTCLHHAHWQSVKACHTSDLPTPVRQHVYLFVLNGWDVFDLAGLAGLRDRVCEAGFPKVYFAQRCDRRWYEYEARRVAREDPAARFVLLGLGAAADQTVPLAAGLIADGVPVDAVFLLDPTGAAAGCDLPCRTVVLRSRHWPDAGTPDGAEVVVFPDAGHLHLPTSPGVVEAVVGQMTASGGQVGPLPAPPVPQLPLFEAPPTPRPLPPPRPVPDAAAPATDEWDFLKRTGPSIPTLAPYPAGSETTGSGTTR